ncbi:MAG TPA: thioredoxin-like domain-containing protein [Bryobacteraceae bacterium]|nr:thioredoxin-like domain-containing protein [Bryobacteraceae bacterium]
MKLLAALLALGLLQAQTSPEQEQQELSNAIAEAGTSSIDFTHALEHHLEKYPDSKRRAEIEKALAKSAVESNDHARIILYGEKVLQAEPKSDDLQLIDRVTRALLNTEDPARAKEALEYAKRYEGMVEAMRSRAAEGHLSPGQWSEQIDKAKARVLVLEARATGNIGKPEDAVKLAKSSWDTHPTAESAREIARWLVKLDRGAEAVEYYADAFAMEDPRTTENDRARDRMRLGELYAKLNGSEKGMGDVILQAYDRTVALQHQRLAAMKMKDPNTGATDLLDYTLPGLDGDGKLALASLKGKTVVMDFWATWCGPCRVQHPMIENVKKKYEKSGNVVFLSIDSDDDHSLVPGFVKEMHWTHPVYFDAGLGHLLNISSIPTVIVLDKSGKIASRMTGFIPERFEDMLTQRIEETRN